RPGPHDRRHWHQPQGRQRRRPPPPHEEGIAGLRRAVSRLFGEGHRGRDHPVARLHGHLGEGEDPRRAPRLGGRRPARPRRHPVEPAAAPAPGAAAIRMNPWRWIRSRRWWVQLIFALVALPIALVLGYVAIRSVMYLGAERDPGVYVPQGANVVVRARDLEAHLKRIQDSPAWRSFERRVLRDAVLRRELNALLKADGAPTLDDLEDERKPFARQKDRVIDVLGDDVVAALQVRESLPRASFCGLVRLRWLYYLATPFARLALPSETIEGEKVLVVRNGPQEVRIAFVGGLAIASNDKILIGQALKRQGREEAPERPLALRVSFEGSPALLQIRRLIQSSGLLPSVRWETARTLALTADVRESTVKIDVALDKAEPLHPTPPPVALRAWAPLSASGVLLTNT